MNLLFFFQNALSGKTLKAEPLFICLEATRLPKEEKPKPRGVQWVGISFNATIWMWSWWQQVPKCDFYAILDHFRRDYLILSFLTLYRYQLSCRIMSELLALNFPSNFSREIEVNWGQHTANARSLSVLDRSLFAVEHVRVPGSEECSFPRWPDLETRHSPL